MTDLTASRSPAWLCLANGEGREIIVVHITLAGFILIQAVNPLCIGKRCQGAGVKDLGLSACEHTGTVYSGQKVHFSRQMADLINGTAVRTLVIL